jgi:hypothetical protein
MASDQASQIHLLQSLVSQAQSTPTSNSPITNASSSNGHSSILALNPSSVFANLNLPLSASTEELLRRVSSQQVQPTDLAAAREAVLAKIRTSKDLASTPLQSTTTGRKAAVGSTGGTSLQRTGREELVSRNGNSSRGRGAARGRKRRRVSVKADYRYGDGEDDEGDENLEDSSEDEGARSSASEFTPSSRTQRRTKSGRRVTRPTPFTPSTKPSRQRRARNSQDASGHRGNYSGSSGNGGSSTACKLCRRLHSPSKNAIVLCDGCNQGWHQSCHEPRIANSLVADESAEWYCSSCRPPDINGSGLTGLISGRLEKEEGGKAITDPLSTPAVSAHGVPESLLRLYLSTLTPETLVELLVRVVAIQPSISVFPAILKNERQLKNITHHVFGGGSWSFGEEWYPQPGCGVQLPNETDDLEWLVEGEETEGFSHIYRETGTVTA